MQPTSGDTFRSLRAVAGHSVCLTPLRDRLWPVVGDIAIGIEHVGSTAVEGMAAKPILDIDIVVSSMDIIDAVIARLQPLGYVHRGNLGIDGREAFAAPENEIPHHLYVCSEGGPALRNHITLRNHLRGHLNDAAAYSALKRQLAHDCGYDIDRYIAGKTDFILSSLKKYRLSEDSLASIRDANLRPMTSSENQR